MLLLRLPMWGGLRGGRPSGPRLNDLELPRALDSPQSLESDPPSLASSRALAMWGCMGGQAQATGALA